jgi:hypothetical protein
MLKRRLILGYSTFKSSGKQPITADQVGAGQIGLSALDPGLFSAIQSISLHNHSGAKSRRVNLKDLEGSFGINGFYMYGIDNVRYHLTIDAGAWVIVAG